LLIPALVALAGGLGGGIVAATVVAPRFARHASAAPATDGKSEGQEDPAGAAVPGKLFRMENLIVNPAGTQGTRFLMASVALQATRPTDQAMLQAREVQLRDVITSVLERQSITMLTEPGARDSLRVALGAAVSPLLPAGARVTVYIPQLVVQ
jgi:flagellar FliL protein